MPKSIFLVTFAFSFGNFAVFLISGHGMLLEPPNRSSMWRFPEWKELNVTENWTDNELFCGGIEMQHLVNNGKCGVCGDNFSDPVPRANEDGGIFGNGIIVRQYNSGEAIPITVNLTTSHWGYFEFRLCSDAQAHLNESCYEENVLEVISSENEKIWELKNKDAWEKLIEVSKWNKNITVPTTTTENPNERRIITKYYVTFGISHPPDNPMQYNFEVQLPQNVKCEQCVLQWQYTTGTNWGECEDGRKDRGCGPQETFRNCADLAIV